MSALKEAWQGIRKPVFVPASIVILAMIVFSVVYAGTAEDAFGSLNSAISDGVGWWYILTATGFVIFALFLRVSAVSGTSGWDVTTSSPSSECSRGLRCSSAPVWVSAWCFTEWQNRFRTT